MDILVGMCVSDNVDAGGLRTTRPGATIQRLLRGHSSSCLRSTRGIYALSTIYLISLVSLSCSRNPYYLKLIGAFSDTSKTTTQIVE